MAPTVLLFRAACAEIGKPRLDLQEPFGEERGRAARGSITMSSSSRFRSLMPVDHRLRCEVLALAVTQGRRRKHLEREGESSTRFARTYPAACWGWLDVDDSVVDSALSFHSGLQTGPKGAGSCTASATSSQPSASDIYNGPETAF